MRRRRRPGAAPASILAVMAAIAGLMVAEPAAAQSIAQQSAAQDEAQAFTLRNFSAAPLATIHVSPDFRNTWGSDRLGSRTVAPGDEVQVNLGSDSGSCYFDVQVGDTDGRQREFWGVNLCTQHTLDVR